MWDISPSYSVSVLIAGHGYIAIFSDIDFEAAHTGYMGLVVWIGFIASEAEFHAGTSLNTTKHPSMNTRLLPSSVGIHALIPPHISHSNITRCLGQQA